MRKRFSEYLYVRQYLKECNIFNGNLLKLLCSFLLSLLIFSGPIAILKSTDNMMIQMLCQYDAGYSTTEGDILIFNDTMKFVMVMIGALVGVVFILTKILFHKIVLKEHKIEGLKSYYLFDGLFYILIAILWSLLLV